MVTSDMGEAFLRQKADAFGAALTRMRVENTPLPQRSLRRDHSAAMARISASTTRLRPSRLAR